MAILKKQYLNLIKLKLIVLALICEKCVLSNEKLGDLLSISSSQLRKTYFY